MDINEDAIRKLAKLLDETELTEIEVAEGDQSIRVCRGQTVVAGAPAHAAVASAPVAASAPAAEQNLADNPGAVISPMVGTAYLQPEPGSPPFAQKGSTVQEGDTLLIIEAMKVMNPIKAHKSGTVTEVLIENAQPVEYGDVLMVIE